MKLSVILLAAAVVTLHAVTSEAQTTSYAAERDCRYEGRPGASSDKKRSIAFPDDDLFAPLLADAKEPRFSLSFRREQFQDAAVPAGQEGPTINAGIVSVGGAFGVWERRPPQACDGIELSFFSGVFSQFNLDAPSMDLINSDFVIGTQLAVRHDRLAGRLRVYHQSSHLGDEFVLGNPSVFRTDFGFMAIHGLAAYESDWWRAYGGAGYLRYMEGECPDAPEGLCEELGPGLLQGGIEVGVSRTPLRAVRPFAALDVTSLQARRWGATTTASAGITWTSASALRRFRALALVVDGYFPFGQFTIRQRLRSLGLQFQVEY